MIKLGGQILQKKTKKNFVFFDCLPSKTFYFFQNFINVLFGRVNKKKKQIILTNPGRIGESLWPTI